MEKRRTILGNQDYFFTEDTGKLYYIDKLNDNLRSKPEPAA